MQQGSQRLRSISILFIGLATLSGLVAAALRLRLELRNPWVEIGMEWADATQIAAAGQTPVQDALSRLKSHGLTTLIVPEDTFTVLETSGAVRPTRVALTGGSAATLVKVDSAYTLTRVQKAFEAHGIATSPATGAPAANATDFTVESGARAAGPEDAREAAPAPASIRVQMSYSLLRTLGVGLPSDAVAAARAARLMITGRISNFPGANVQTAGTALAALREQGARMVIFMGDDVLGYRGMEKEVAWMLRQQGASPPPAIASEGLVPSHLVYGAVEFSKQRGDDLLTHAMQGDYVRVHTIQAAEMPTMSPAEAVERYAKAARERNIRFLYVRPVTFAGADPVGENAAFLNNIAHAVTHGNRLIGGGMAIRESHRYGDTRVPAAIFGLIALGTAAGLVWMVRLCLPIAPRTSVSLLILAAIVCAGAAMLGGEMGRKLVALLAGIVFPTIACLETFPQGRRRDEYGVIAYPAPTQIRESVRAAVGKLAMASAITLLGIIEVVGLLASRSFMVVANQFLGIKAQHAIPIVIILIAAMAGGVPGVGESWAEYRRRAKERFSVILSEPLRMGLTVFSLIALAVLALVIARTGNDAGVGVSSLELKGRALLEVILPVRPRTKEFLVGHPAFILGWAWWLRGRRRLAIPCFLVGTLGQVSILNTFCHIHTPLLVSFWRDVIGLIVGSIFGIVIFLVTERLLRDPEPSRREQTEP